MANVRVFSRLAVTFLSIALVPLAADAQFVGRNINMVSGTTWPTGDPFLQRQNEGSVAAGLRNPMHLVGGSNDYRTVDLPGLPGDEETGDAWLGLFKSTDGGQTWISNLVPGYPQDTTADGIASPLRQIVNGVKFTAGADPMVRSALGGMFYYSGIAMTRETFPLSAVFVARFNDRNDREYKDPIAYIGTSIVADGRPFKTPNASKFYDKPSLAVDFVPRFGSSTCSAGGQTFLGGNVYVVYTVIESHLQAPNTVVTDSAKLYLSRSIDCAGTWSAPILISGTHTVNQGSVMAVDARTGTLYVVWRRIARGAETNALLATKSTDGGKTFSTPVVIRSITPFEQGTTEFSFRTPAYPTATTDADGRLYVAWAERSGPSGGVSGAELADGRIMLVNSPDGVSWSSPVMVAPTAPIAPLSGRGMQFMPALSYASGKLMLIHYDLREDSTIGQYAWSQANPFFTETRKLAGDLGTNPQNLNNVFNNYVQDAGVFGTLLRRHTLDIRVAQANPGALPVFQASTRVSSYRFGYTTTDPTIRQLEFNPPNFKMFKQGTVPFFGDYIDLAPQYPFVSSILNLPFPAPAFHAVWTDNRDVRPPADGDWTKYTPPFSSSNTGFSKIDGSALTPCDAAHSDRAGMRNQNIYTARITAGLFFGSPGNDKPLGTIQRAFVVTVQNSKSVAQSYRLQIVNQPVGGKASFQQLPLNAPALTSLDITVNARSTAARSVFVTSSIKSAPVGVTVTEIGTIGGGPSPNALTSALVLNPDPSSPDIGSPDIGTPDIGSSEVYTPDIGTPDIGSPDIGTPDIGSPDIGSPDIGTPDIGTPDIGTPDIGTPTYATPDIGTPDIGTPDIGSNSVTDTTWPVTNDGNTTASYSTKLLKTGDIPAGIKLQLILHQSYKTPVARDCALATETTRILLNNVPNPTVLTSANGIGSPDIGSATVPTVSIVPGQPINLTVRVVDPVHPNRHIPATDFLTPVIVAHAVNTADLSSPNPQPSVSMVITTPSLPDGVRTAAYNSGPLTALFGAGALTWSVVPPIEGPALPPGLQISSTTGAISGTPTLIGTYTFTVTVHDSATPVQRRASRNYTIRISNPLTFGGAELPTGIVGATYKANFVANGGLQPLHWTTGPGFPPGLSLSDGGAISGTPATGGTFDFMIGVSDSSVPAQRVSSVSVEIVVAPATYTVVARLKYNGQPTTPSTTPGFFLRNNDNNTVVTLDHVRWNNNDTVTISGIVAGNYGFEVISKEGATAVHYPGSFYGFANFDALTASDAGFNLTLTRLIHLTAPEDNSIADASFACPPALSYPALSQITWQNIEIPATYSYAIQLVTCPFTNPTVVRSGSVTDNSGSATFAPLPPNGANDFYLLTLYAFAGGTEVGQIMTNAPNNGGWSWDLRFTVPQPANTAVNLTPATAGSFVQGQSFNETRLAEVLVEGVGNVTISSMTLSGLNAGNQTLVGARIYDSNWTIVATADSNTEPGPGQTISVPISAVLAAGGTYRIGFFIQTNPAGGASGDFLQPTGWSFSPAAGWTTPAYDASPSGWLQIQRAWSFASDSPATTPPNQNLAVPQVTVAGAR